MDGMSMMFKALGVDPNAIMGAAQTFQTGLVQVMQDLETIKRQQSEILYILREAKSLDVTMPSGEGEETAGIPPQMRSIANG